MCYADAKLNKAKQLLKRLMEHGHQAYFVGGFVRDVVLQREVDDIDIATSARPEQVMELFANTVPTGLQHGTVTVIDGQHTFEVTTFRYEAAYEDYRHPQSVQFIDNLIEDLQRRDFTMNAMAMDIDSKLIDPFGGRSDLADKRLRCVGEPSLRFEEDALRMLRCIRFAANYELEIAATTWQALIEQRTTLQYIAMERVRVELEKMIDGASPQIGLQLLFDSQLLNYCKSGPLVSEQALQQCLQSKAALVLPELRRSRQKWALLLLFMGCTASTAQHTLRKLTCSKGFIAKVCVVLEFHLWITKTERKQLDWVLGCLQFGEEALHDWLHLWQALRDTSVSIPAHWSTLVTSLDHLLQHGKAWLEEMAVRERKDLCITGQHLIDLGVKPGAMMGNLLHRLLIDAASGLVPNEQQKLERHAMKLMKELDDHD